MMSRSNLHEHVNVNRVITKSKALRDSDTAHAYTFSLSLAERVNVFNIIFSLRLFVNSNRIIVYLATL